MFGRKRYEKGPLRAHFGKPRAPSCFSGPVTYIRTGLVRLSTLPQPRVPIFMSDDYSNMNCVRLEYKKIFSKLFSSEELISGLFVDASSMKKWQIFWYTF